MLCGRGEVTLDKTCTAVFACRCCILFCVLHYVVLYIYFFIVCDGLLLPELTNSSLSRSLWLQEPGEERPVDEQHPAGQVSPATTPSPALSSTAKGQTQPPNTQYLCACSHTIEGDVFMMLLCAMLERQYLGYSTKYKHS